MTSERVQDELRLLRQHYPDLEFQEDGTWVLIPKYSVPPGIWNRDEVAVCFQFPLGYPGNEPYGIYVSPKIELSQGGEVLNRTDTAEPPFEGEWVKFSWDIPEWHATADLQSGSNMLNFVLTFYSRFEEGA